MPAKQHELLVALLEAARCEEIGVVVISSDPVRARAALYRARATENNPNYADLQFRMWPYEDGDLIICHGGQVPNTKPNNLGSIDLSGVLDLDIEP